MHDREIAGVRRAIEWLHERAKEMNDPHAEQVLNSAAFSLGQRLREWRAGQWSPPSAEAGG